MGLIALRHPKVAGAGLCYGRHDPPLAPEAPAQIAAAIEALQALQLTPTTLLTSPAARCQALAARAAAALSLPLTSEPRLQELDFGTWEGRRWDDIPRAQSDPWAADPIHRAPPGGESFETLRTRVAACLRSRTETVLITHAGPIRALMILTQGLSFEEAFATPVPYASPLIFPAF